MPGLTVPDADVFASEATLGTTAAYTNRRGWSTKLGTSPGTNLEKWQGLFHSLPTELHFNIMGHLYQDPASQICFGLTSSYFYWQVFHEMADRKYGDGGTKYLHPNDLRLQVSSCGQYSLFGLWEYGFLLDAWDIDWHPCLKELLCEEHWLWGDLKYCEGCAKYKPKGAFGEFSKQQEMLKAVEDRQFLEAADFWWLENICKRCTAKELFRYMGEREEVLEQGGNAWEERESFGLKRLAADDKTQEGIWEECETGGDIYETWESIFSKLGI